MEATQNMFDLISRRFQSGNKSPEAIFFRQHTSFFENQTHSADLIELWLEHEIELREEHHIKPSAFNHLKYSSVWTRVEAKWDIIKQQAQVFNLYPNVPIPELIRRFKTGTLSNTQNSKNSSYPSSTSTYQPFRRGNGEQGSRTPRCIGCGAKGHTLAGHKYAEHGGFPMGEDVRSRSHHSHSSEDPALHLLEHLRKMQEEL
ncbi:hypothetical protein FB446DRAFT_504002 [Lentinula raphanica]|nr:hypothetical protein FB446DRAFT_504002 [Lentinula raphanica]